MVTNRNSGFATYKEIARLAHVSTATVSRVLARSGNVSPSKRERVLQIAESLDYKVSRAARALRQEKSETIGLIVSDVEYPFVSSIVRNIEKLCYGYGYSVIIGNTDENIKVENDYVNLMIEEKGMGVIISPATETSDSVSILTKAKIPVVTVDRISDDSHADSVLLDNFAATECIVSTLIKHGYKKFLAALGTTNATPSRERAEALRALLCDSSDYQLSILNSRLGDNIGMNSTIESYGKRVLKILNEMKSKSTQPVAIICANSVITISVINSLVKENFKVPDDVAVVGYDDFPGFELYATPVTVVNQSVRDISNIAVSLLLKRIKNFDVVRSVIRVKPEFIERKSC